MNTPFVKFPRTPHLAWLGTKSPRDDKVLKPKEAEEFLRSPVLIEEKVDGTNIGISVDPRGLLRPQSRGDFLSQGGHPQFGPLWSWLAKHTETLIPALGSNLVLFGEWCFAVHTVRYSRLPDWFLAFDVFDRSQGGFWSAVLRDRLVASLGIAQVPELRTGAFTLGQLKELLRTDSRLGEHPMEGIYLRREEGSSLIDRAKLVRATFIESIAQHWSAGPLRKNALEGAQRTGVA